MPKNVGTKSDFSPIFYWNINLAKGGSLGITLNYVNLGYKIRTRKGWFLAFSEKNMPVFIFFWPWKSYNLFLFCYPSFLFFLTKSQSQSQSRHQLLLIWWVLVSIICKISHSWIRNLGFNFRLYKKLINILVWW